MTQRSLSGRFANLVLREADAVLREAVCYGAYIAPSQPPCAAQSSRMRLDARWIFSCRLSCAAAAAAAAAAEILSR